MDYPTRFKKGQIPWNKRGHFIPCMVCQNQTWVEPKQIGRKKFCSKECLYSSGIQTKTYQKGHPKSFLGKRVHSEETKRKISLSGRGKHSGPLAWNWKGGCGTERHRLMSAGPYRDWRKSVFERDNYTCQECNLSNTYLHADHIIDWALDKNLRYEVSNGRTLCYLCHYKKTFGRADKKKAMLWGIPSKYRTGGEFL